jgi:hypothetical protein
MFREIPGPGGQKQYYGSPAVSILSCIANGDILTFEQVLAALCNSIMADDRVFTITDPKFMDKYNKQGSLTSTS